MSYMGLSHRDRVILAINRKEPDRPPSDLGGPAWSIVETPPYGYSELCEYLGLKDVSLSLKGGSKIVASLDERLLKRFDIDFRWVKMDSPEKELPGDIVEDCFGVRWKLAVDHYYPIDPPLRDAKSLVDIEDYSGWPDPEDPVFTDGKREEARKLQEETDYAVGGDIGIVRSVFHMYAFLRGFNQWFIDMKINPEFYKALSDKMLELNTQVLERFLGEVGDYLDVVYLSDDAGAQSGLLMSVEDYRKYFKPWFKISVNNLKRMVPKAKILYHTCGSVYPLIPDFIECGIDVLNPIQPLAKNMEPERLKHEFGDKICFHGGIDQQKVLPLGKPEEVKSYVERVLSVMAPGGGYIMAPSHQIQGDVPPENIYTMYMTLLEYSGGR